MKIFDASMRWYKCGTFDDRNFLAIANTESEALGMILEGNTDTKAEDWTLTEIDYTTTGIHYISSHSN
jgi:hypothetical protein